MTTHSIFKATRSPHYMTQAQRSRMRGPVLPMLPDKRPSLVERVRARWAGARRGDSREMVV